MSSDEQGLPAGGPREPEPLPFDISKAPQARIYDFLLGRNVGDVAAPPRVQLRGVSGEVPPDPASPSGGGRVPRSPAPGQLNQPDGRPWSARCIERRTAGAARGPGKRAGSNLGTAPRA
jgi:hypothetical protein